MHFFSYEDRSLGYPRKIEKIFRIVNKALWAVQLSLAMIGIVLLVLAAEDMFTESPLAAGASLSLNSKYTSVFNNCSSTSTTDTYLLKSVPFTIDGGNVRFLLGLYSSKVIAAIVLAAVSVAVSLCNRILYDLNVFFFRYKFLIIRKDILSTVDIILLCGSIAANSIAHDFAAPLRNHVEHCTSKFNAGIIASSSSPSTPQISTGGARSYLAPENFIPMYLAACFSLLLYVIEFILLIKFTIIDSEVTAPPEGAEESENGDDGNSNGDDENGGDKKMEPMADPTKEKPPQSTLDRRKEERILEQQRKKAAEEGGGNATNADPQIQNNTNNNNYTGVVDSPNRVMNNRIMNNPPPPPPPPLATNDVRSTQQQQNNIMTNTNRHHRGGFAAMRAAAAFRAASRANSTSGNGETNNNNQTSASPSTTTYPPSQQNMIVANSGAMYSDPGRRSSYAGGASTTPHGQY